MADRRIDRDTTKKLREVADRLLTDLLTDPDVARVVAEPLIEDAINSGDLILVELMVTSKNDYTDLAFEDPKPAGGEPVALRSGTVVGEGVSHMELRDEKVVFFLPQITQGKLKLSYRLRAEVPGSFSAMPTKAFAMYAPEIKANSDEMKLRINDVP